MSKPRLTDAAINGLWAMMLVKQGELEATGDEEPQRYTPKELCEFDAASKWIASIDTHRRAQKAKRQPR